MRILKLELKPCPFCGSTNVFPANAADGWAFILCGDCSGSAGYGKTREEAAKKWNARVTIKEDGEYEQNKENR